ncbi:glycosyl hydrolase family 18 protein [Oleiagrimonas sp.]|jgi:spore germination protein YaaH|uniref:glycosyl hydrolase family 18 protein n=1 Tax=Oleiagrimonas sp. TaxID=2010330 RepID=UPI002608C565|nr:glycosyl hydrolase family 18 protein [Oleiagrimonas sp.]MDA3915078.1 glycosyl hydrolase family 18 protein [Oleiagrimonas sp.]
MQKRPSVFEMTGESVTHIFRTRWLAIAGSTLFGLACVISLLPGLPNKPQHPLAHVPASGSTQGILKPGNRQACEERTRNPQWSQRRIWTPSNPAPAPLMSLEKPHDRALAIGFYVNWDASSYSSLRRALPTLDWVIPTWTTVGGPNMALNADIDSKALQLIRTLKPATPILPLLQNTFEGKWDGEGLARMLENPAMRQARIAEIVSFLDAHHFQGVTIDFEEVTPAMHHALKAFLSELRLAFLPHGWAIVLSVPFDDASWDYAGYAKLVDFELLMGYDQHWGGKQAGSIAAKGWFERTLHKRMKQLDPEHTIIALGSYGYDWAAGSNAEVLTFDDALRRAANSQAHISFDFRTQNPHYSYNDHAGIAHQVWFLDGITASNQIHAADNYKPYAYVSSPAWLLVLLTNRSGRFWRHARIACKGVLCPNAVWGKWSL